MKIPRVIKVGGHKIHIRQVDVSEMSDALGEASSELNLIRIRKDIPQDQQEETLIHEVLHIINGELTEKEVQWTAHSLYQFLHDNNLIK